jgi:hypothetical protein
MTMSGCRDAAALDACRRGLKVAASAVATAAPVPSGGAFHAELDCATSKSHSSTTRRHNFSRHSPALGAPALGAAQAAPRASSQEGLAKLAGAVSSLVALVAGNRHGSCRATVGRRARTARPDRLPPSAVPSERGPSAARRRSAPRLQSPTCEPVTWIRDRGRNSRASAQESFRSHHARRLRSRDLAARSLHARCTAARSGELRAEPTQPPPRSALIHETTESSISHSHATRQHARRVERVTALEAPEGATARPSAPSAPRSQRALLFDIRGNVTTLRRRPCQVRADMRPRPRGRPGIESVESEALQAVAGQLAVRRERRLERARSRRGGVGDKLRRGDVARENAQADRLQRLHSNAGISRGVA